MIPAKFLLVIASSGAVLAAGLAPASAAAGVHGRQPGKAVIALSTDRTSLAIFIGARIEQLQDAREPIRVALPDPDPRGEGVADRWQSFDLIDPGRFAGGFDLRALVGGDLNAPGFREIVIHGMALPAASGAAPVAGDGATGFLLILPAPTPEGSEIGFG